MKDRILLMAFDLFSQYGIKRVSMDDIARNLGISKRTLYGLFSDKETLLLEGIAHIGKRMTALFDNLEKGDYTALDIVLLSHEELMVRPRWFSEQFYEDLKKYPNALQRLEEDKTLFAERSRKLLNRGIQEGVIREGVNVEIVALLAKEQIKMIHPSKSFSHLSNLEVYNTVLVTFLRGISTEKGNEILDKWIQVKNIKKTL